jgi:hypothetical protein
MTKTRTPRPITLDDAIELAAASSLTFLTGEELERLRERLAESEAENAWLRAAENAGWEEAYLESLIESGLRLP